MNTWTKKWPDFELTNFRNKQKIICIHFDNDTVVAIYLRLKFGHHNYHHHHDSNVINNVTAFIIIWMMISRQKFWFFFCKFFRLSLHADDDHAVLFSTFSWICCLSILNQNFHRKMMMMMTQIFNFCWGFFLILFFCFFFEKKKTKIEIEIRQSQSFKS